MPQAIDLTAVYLVCFHSEKSEPFVGAKGQFLVVEQAISAGEWPYDNGDDPSFYVARKGGPLTWGVCRQDVRNSIRKGSIVVFFSFTSSVGDHTRYRLCAVTTVKDKIDVRTVHRDSRLARFHGSLINCLIRPDEGGWRHDESDRPVSQRHSDWLWRIADHDRQKHEEFNRRYADVYGRDWISDSALTAGEPGLAKNYVCFATEEPEAYISPCPPVVAIARSGEHEKWSNPVLRSLTVDHAAQYLTSGRDYLRTANRSGRNVHRQIRFSLQPDEAILWRNNLIRALQVATREGQGGLSR